MVKHPGGRPTRYNKIHHPIEIKLACKLGYTEEEAAKELGVCKATITNWKKKHPEFLAALKKGKSEPDDEVEKSLFIKAIGYEYSEMVDEMIIVKDKNGKEKQTGAIKRKIYKKKMAPDTTAQIFWLKNRRREKWRDKQDLTINAPDEIVITRIKAKEDE